MSLEVITIYKLIYIFMIMIFLHCFCESILLRTSIFDYRIKDNWLLLKDKYENDFRLIILCRSFIWSFIVHLPILILHRDGSFYLVYSVSIIVHTLLHGIIDDIRTNQKLISLLIEQSFHILQLIIIAVMFGSISILYIAVA